MERKILQYFICLINSILVFYFKKTSAQYVADSNVLWTVSANAEFYYNYHLLFPHNESTTPFLVSYNQNNKAQINFLNINLQHHSEFFHFQISGMYGTYAQFNMSNEPQTLRYIDRLNAGIKLHSKKNLWLYAGILSSHIGYESNYGYDNWFASRFITSDNTPYFETGIRLEYQTLNKKWLYNLNLLNGWQTIVYDLRRQFPSIGHQIQYQPNKYCLLNSSSFIGFFYNHIRWFHNFYLSYTLKKFTLLTIFDIGYQKYTWFSYGIAIKYDLLHNISIATRYEHYSDIYNIIIPEYNQYTVFNNFSAGLNIKFGKYVLFKTEYRYFYSDGNWFNKASVPFSYPYLPIIYNTLIFHL